MKLGKNLKIETSRVFSIKCRNILFIDLTNNIIHALKFELYDKFGVRPINRINEIR